MRLLSWTGWGGRAETVQDYAGVLVPLVEAHLYSHSARSGRCEFEERASPERGREGGEEHEDEEDDDDGGAVKDDDDRERTGMLQMSVAEYSIEGLRRAVGRGERGRQQQWTEYELKSKLVNKAIQDIGMGRYNWQLFILCGFGWFADNLWMQGLALVLPSLSGEFDVAEKTVRYTTSAVYAGLCVGSFFWGIGADVLGRRIAFNMTLLITGLFGVGIAYASSWGGVCFLFACMGFGVGGNLPVDGALFLEFLPDASSSLLTLLSVWWPIGQLVSSLIAWYLITTRPVEVGWRSFIWTIGIITLAMFALRFFVFHLFESPKYLLSQGRQAEAVAVVHGVAYRNGTKTWLTQDIMDSVVEGEVSERSTARLSTTSIIKQNLASFSGQHLRPLFSTRKLAVATGLVWFCWAAIGMGYPLFNAFLPQYLSHTGAGAGGGGNSSSATRQRQRHMARSPSDGSPLSERLSAEAYRNYAIISMAGVPGSLLAAYTVDLPSALLGRKGTLATSTLASAIFLYLFVTLGTTPARQLFFTCVEAFTQNIMYGVLYAYTPEIFPAPVRGAGTGVASFLNRITGLLAPLLAANMPGDGTKLPIYISAVLILAAFMAMCLIPIETRGRQRL